jgi:hypothetical protein
MIAAKKSGAEEHGLQRRCVKVDKNVKYGFFDGEKASKRSAKQTPEKCWLVRGKGDWDNPLTKRWGAYSKNRATPATGSRLCKHPVFSR